MKLNPISRLEVIGFGAMNMDHLYRVSHIVLDDETLVEKIESFPGGSAANTIYALAKLGVKTGFIGAVGDDEEGKKLIADFNATGVDTSQIKVKQGAKTGSVLCLSNNSGRRSLYVLPGANNLLNKGDIDLPYLNQGRILHLSSFVGEKQFNLQLNLVKKLSAKVKISFAPGAFYARKGLKALSPLLERTHILFINRKEIEQLTGKDFIPGAKTCLEQGCETIAITLGEGLKLKTGRTIAAYICHKEKECMVQSETESKQLPLETLGAGDAFAAGFLFGILKGKGLEECGVLGDLTARFSLTRKGAREGLPTLTQLAEKFWESINQRL